MRSRPGSALCAARAGSDELRFLRSPPPGTRKPLRTRTLRIAHLRVARGVHLSASHAPGFARPSGWLRWRRPRESQRHLRSTGNSDRRHCRSAKLQRGRRVPEHGRLLHVRSRLLHLCASGSGRRGAPAHPGSRRTSRGRRLRIRLCDRPAGRLRSEPLQRRAGLWPRALHGRPVLCPLRERRRGRVRRLRLRGLSSRVRERAIVRVPVQSNLRRPLHPRHAARHFSTDLPRRLMRLLRGRNGQLSWFATTTLAPARGLVACPARPAPP